MKSEEPGLAVKEPPLQTEDSVTAPESGAEASTDAQRVSIPVVQPEVLSLEDEPVTVSVRTGAETAEDSDLIEARETSQAPEVAPETQPKIAAFSDPERGAVSGSRQFSPFRYNRRAFTITGSAIMVMLLIGLGTWLFATRNGGHSGNKAAQNYSIGNLKLNGIKAGDQLQIGQATQLTVNGRLQVSNTIILTPTSAPTAPVAGQIYYDKGTNTPYYYNGTRFVSLAPRAGVTSLGGSTGAISLGGGLSLTGSQLSISASVLQQLASAAAAGGPQVSSIQGRTGAVTLSAGSGINISGTTIANSGVIGLTSGSSNLVIGSDGNGHYTISSIGGSGVSSISGTANQVNVSASTGNVVLSLPQSIAATSSPTFGGLTVNGTATANTLNATSAIQVNGSQISSSNLSDNANLAKLNGSGPQTFSGNNKFTGTVLTQLTSSAAFQIQNGGGTSNLFVADTATNRIGVGTAGPGYKLDVQGGDINTSGIYRVNGAQISSANLSNDSDLAKLGNANTFTSNNTFAGTVAVQSTNGLTLGSGSNAGGIIFRDGSTANAGTLRLGGALSANVEFDLPVATGTQTLCTVELGNCAGSGSGITGSGTTGQLAKFVNGQQIGDSSISDDGTVVTVATGQVIQGASGLTLGASGVDGKLVFTNSSNANTLTLQSGVTTGNLTLTLPTADGSDGQCLKTNGLGALAFADCTGGAGGGVTSVNSLTGVISLVGTANQISVSTAGNTITLALPQDINTNGNATFRTVTLNGAAAADNLIVANAVVGATGNLIELAVNGVDKFIVDPSGNVNATGQYEINGVQIGSANLGDGANLAKLDGTGPQTFTGDNKFTGTVLVQNATDSTEAFQIQNAAGTSDLFDADTSNSRIGIGTTAPAYTLDVNGDVNTSGVYRVNGVAVCTSSGCTAAGGSGDYIQNGTSPQTADFNITGTGTIGGITIGNDCSAASITAMCFGDGLNLYNYNNGNALATSGLFSSGSLYTTGSLSFGTFHSTSFTTPSGATVDTKINIPLFDPGAYSQLIALGLPKGSATSARAITVFDARDTTNNQPPLAVISPDESNIFGLSWEGASTTGYLKVGSGGALDLRSGTNDLANFNSGGAAIFKTSSNTTSALQLWNSSNQEYLQADSANGRLGVGLLAAPANGVLTVGTNTTAASGGLYFGTDTNLYRGASGQLNTDGALNVGQDLTVQGNQLSFGTGATLIANGSINSLELQGARFFSVGSSSTDPAYCAATSGDPDCRFQIRADGLLEWGPGNAAVDTNLYRGGDSILQTDGGFRAGGEVSSAYGLTANQLTLYSGASGAIYSAASTIDLAGGSGSTGCTIDGTTGGLTCSGNITGASAGTVGYWTRTGTTLQPANTGDNLSVSGTGTLNVNSATALQVQDGSGGSVFTVDSSNSAARAVLGGTNKGDSILQFQRSGTNTYSIGSDSSALGGADSLFIYNDTESNYVAAFRNNGSAWFQNSTDSSAAFRVQNTSGDAILNVDTTGNGALNVSGVDGWVTNIDQNSISFSRGSANYISASDAAGELYFGAGGASNNLVLASDGRATFKNTTDSTAAFQIQKSDGTPLFTADTSNMRIQIGNSGTPVGQLFVSGGAPAAAAGSVTVTGAGFQDMRVEGSYAYAIDFYNSILDVVSLADPASPSVVGSVATGSGPQGLDVSGNYAYVADFVGSDMETFDISNPSAPTKVGSLDLGNKPIAITVSGKYAYVGTQNSHIYVVDISNPYNPFVVTNYSASTPLAMYVSGNYLYYVDAGTSGGFHVIDISDPANPSSVGSLTLSGQSACGTGNLLSDQNVYVAGRYAYVSTCSNDLIDVVDISNPASPALVGSGISTGSSTGPMGVSVQGRYLYTALYNSNSVGIYDVSDPSSPTLVGTVSNGANSGPLSVIPQGRYLYVNDWLDSNINVYDLGGGYVQQLESGSEQTGQLRVTGNSSFGGNVSVQGGITVGSSAAINGALGVGGPVLFQNATDSTTALQVQNSTGKSLFTINTTGNGEIDVAQNTNLCFGLNSCLLEDTDGDTFLSNYDWSHDIYLQSNSLYYQDSSQSNAIEFAIANNGQATFKNAVDSTNAFQVQNAGGSSVLNVNTADKAVTVTAGTDSATLGSELFTSGTSFPATTGWTSISGTGQSATATHASGTTALSPTPALGISSDTTYMVSWDVDNPNSGGSLTITMGGQTVATYNFNASDAGYSFTDSAVITTSSTANLAFTPNSAFTGTVTNVSVKELTENWSPAFVVNNTSGVSSLEVRSSGDDSNMFVGHLAGLSNVDGGGNTALGSWTLQSNVSGDGNTAVGSGAMENNVTGDYNVALGRNALQANVSGDSNVAIGSEALVSNLQGSSSVAIGDSALASNIDGGDNVAIGSNALSSNVSSWENVAIGSGALQSFTGTTNGSNTAVGYAALVDNVSGYNNTSFGSYALEHTTGNENAAFGTVTLRNNTTGSQNTTIGTYSLDSNTTGNNNVAVGYSTLTTNTTGSYNTVLGDEADVLYSGLNGATAIGSGAVVGSNNTIILGYNSDWGVANHVGIGTSYAQNPFEVAPNTYDTGTISQTSGSGAVVGAGTSFDSTMLGGTLFYPDGGTGVVTAVADATHLTSSNTTENISGSDYAIVWGGFNVNDDASVYLQNTTDSEHAFDVVNTSGSSVLRVTTDGSDYALTVNGGINSEGDVNLSNNNVVAWNDGNTFIQASDNGSSSYMQFVVNNHQALNFGNDGSAYFDGASATFQTSNSATAFQILQATTNASLFNADTSGMNITMQGGYSGETSAWASTSGTGIPAAREGNGVVIANGYIYSIGGYNGSAQANVYYAKINANGTIGTWASTTGLGSGKDTPGVVFSNGYIYVLGGGTSRDVLYAKPNADGTISSWTTMTNELPANKTTGFGTVANNGYIYISGGDYYDSGATDYAKQNPDGSLGAFTATTGFPSGVDREVIQTVASNGYIYAFGGWYSGNDTTRTEVYRAPINANGTLGTWTATGVAALPAARQAYAAVSMNGYIYVMGGISTNSLAGTPTNTVYYAKVNADGTITSWNTSSHTLPDSLRWVSGAAANGYLYTVAGDDGVPVSAVYYASTARVQIAGSLDLVGINGGNLANPGSGGTLTAGDTDIVGSLQVQGQANFAQGVAVSGNLSVGGTLSVSNGLSISCTSGQALNGITVSGGIVTGGTCATNASDYAEYYESDETLSPGQIVTTASGDYHQVGKSTAPYQSNLIGVVSTNPAYVIGGDGSDGQYPIALSGRVPVQVNTENGPIQKGDKITSSSTPGVGMKATGSGMVIGTALESYDGTGTGTIEVFVGTSYYGGEANADYIQNGGDATLNNLTVGGTANFSDINVAGTATINNLAVTGSASIADATIGTLTVTSSAKFAGDITIGGHIITSGGEPTSLAQTAAGGSASVAVDGTDTTGTITITTGADPEAGELAKILFSKIYGQAPHVVLSPSNDKAAALRFYKGATSATDFMLNALDVPQANTVYQFDYFIAQ